MKIILSRKGFDSTAGGSPSPVINNNFISLLIPDDKDSIYYKDLKTGDGTSFLDLMLKLGIKHFDENSKCHLDPDINKNVLTARVNTWKPTMGQIDRAQTHLKNQEVSEGDLFLFFGRFRKVENNKFVGADFHAIWGYLQIGEIIKEPKLDDKSGLEYHPHYRPDRLKDATNTIYVASEKLFFNKSLSGAGLLGFSEDLVLTKDGYSVSRWKLIDIFKNLKITYHPDPIRDGYFQSACRGQEFVIKDNEEKDAEKWVINLIKKYAKN